MIRFKSVTPRTHLILDIISFVLFVALVISALVQLLITEADPAYLLWHHIHGIAGILFSSVIMLHLLLHIRWIESQIKRLFKHPAAYR
ncbi:MAG: hypothetical protein HY866_08010 [Chloroflexi bacterium]|nr:hypothetical protein [Chloroflexota bacterium]